MEEEKKMGAKEKEIENQKEEMERRAGVVLTKAMGGMIEQVDKLRRQGKAASLLGRLSSNMGLLPLIEELKTAPSSDSSSYEVVRYALKIHEGICEDFKNSLKMKDEQFEKQFPTPSSCFETPEHLTAFLVQLSSVEQQMSTYLFRFFV